MKQQNLLLYTYCTLYDIVRTIIRPTLHFEVHYVSTDIHYRASKYGTLPSRYITYYVTVTIYVRNPIYAPWLLIVIWASALHVIFAFIFLCRSNLCDKMKFFIWHSINLIRTTEVWKYWLSNLISFHIVECLKEIRSNWHVYFEDGYTSKHWRVWIGRITKASV